jgi:transposase-like protein
LHKTPFRRPYTVGSIASWHDARQQVRREREGEGDPAGARARWTYRTQRAAISAVSGRLGMSGETLRKWICQAEVDEGGAPEPGSLRSTVVGHSGSASAYWYLSASPVLMALAAQRLRASIAAAQNGKTPSALDFSDLGTPLITCFLDHLEHQRGNTARTRNRRVAAIRSMFAYATRQHPEHAGEWPGRRGQPRGHGFPRDARLGVARGQAVPALGAVIPGPCSR